VTRAWSGLALWLALAAPVPAAAGGARPDSVPAAPEPGTRTIYLVRHGEYDEEDPRDPEIGRALSPRGREQSRRTGERLAALPVPFDRIHSSTMTRARETAEIIAALVSGPAPEPSPDLAECTPPTSRAEVMARYRPASVDSCRMRLERAWDRIFRASPERDSVEVVVCHGNVIRYFACRALRVDPEAWLNMATANCSVTAIQVRADGAPRLLSYGDLGHLPTGLQTWADYRWDPGLKPRTR